MTRSRTALPRARLYAAAGFGLGLLGIAAALSADIVPLPLAVVLLGLQPVLIAAVAYGFGRRADADIGRQEVLAAEREDLVKALSERTQHADDTERSLRTIVNHLDTGICTVDRDLAIDENFNAEFVRIFGRSDFAGRSLSRTVFATWNDKQKSDLREAVELAFLNTASSDEMLNNILPSAELVTLGAVPGDAKYVSVSLSRIFAAGAVEKVMFLFKDITLTKKLKEEEERHQRIVDDQYRRIHQLLKHERSVVFGFFGTFTAAMDRIAAALRALSQAEDSRPLLREVIAAVHTVKGEAFSLELETCAEKAKALETYIRSAEKAEFGLEQHLEVIGLYENLADERRIFERMLGRMAEFTQAGAAGAADAMPDADADQALSELAKPLGLACERAAKETGKQAVLELESESLVVPTAIFRPLKEALIHLVRNSVGHGIESVDERLAAGKPAVGHIKIDLRRTGDALIIDFGDDGRGFDYERIRATIVAKGLRGAEEVKSMAVKDLIPFLFQADFSTRTEADMVSGAGAGLYEVKNIITATLKGKLAITGASRKGLSYRINLPWLKSAIKEGAV